MNLLGHNYIAFKLLGMVDKETFVGSHVPDFVPFLPTSVLTFDEIHEGGKGFYEFIKKAYPQHIKLPLAMLCHSKQFGADEYNRDIETWLLNNDLSLFNKLSGLILQTSNISELGARMHNYLWCGVDMYLLKHGDPKFITSLQELSGTFDFNLYATMLGQYFNKDSLSILKNLTDFFSPITKDTFQSPLGYAKFWKVFISALPDHDCFDIAQGTQLFEFIYDRFEDKWPAIIAKVEKLVSAKLAPFLTVS